MTRYKLTFTDKETNTSYLLGDNISGYDTAVITALDYVAAGASKADENNDQAALARLFTVGLTMAEEFASQKGFDKATSCGFTITRKGY